jgi:hypothetical protein
MSSTDNNAGYVTINATAYGNQVEEVTHELIVPTFEGVTPARVRLTGSVTKNLGNYNSARVEASIEMPCLPEASEIARVSKLIADWIDEILDTQVSRIEPNV